MKRALLCAQQSWSSFYLYDVAKLEVQNWKKEYFRKGSKSIFSFAMRRIKVVRHLNNAFFTSFFSFLFSAIFTYLQSERAKVVGCKSNSYWRPKTKVELRSIDFGSSFLRKKIENLKSSSSFPFPFVDVR